MLQTEHRPLSQKDLDLNLVRDTDQLCYRVSPAQFTHLCKVGGNKAQLTGWQKDDIKQFE